MLVTFAVSRSDVIRKVANSFAIVIVLFQILVDVNGYPIIGEPFIKDAPFTPEATAVPTSSSTLEESPSPSTTVAPNVLNPSTTSAPESGTLLSSTTSASPLLTVKTHPPELMSFTAGVPETSSSSDSTTSLPVSTERTTSAETFGAVVDDTMFEHFALKPQIIKAKPVWTHKDTTGWHSQFPTCGGLQQSPIDIQPKSTVLTAYPKFTFHNYGNIENMELINNGHSAVFNLPPDYPIDDMPHITGGGLENTFAFVQFHLHWGNNSSQGSEHLIKSKGYPAEMHMVHFNTKYGSFAEASKYEDGVAVLAIFLKVGSSDSQSFQPLVEQLGEIAKDGDEVILRNPISLSNLLPGRTSSFYRYSGSLTTPACQQIVIWTIFDTPLEVSENQLEKFRHLKGDDGTNMVNNFRPTLPVNGRTIFYRSFTGCEISRSWPITSSPFSEAFKWSKCLMGFAYKSAAPSL